MLAETFLDTNVLVYAAYPKHDEEWKRKIASDLIARERFAISTQVMVEFVNSTTRKRKPGLSPDTVREWLNDLRASPVIGADDVLVMEGLDLGLRFKIDFLDGLIVAAARRAGARTLYTEDLNHGQRYGEVTVVNPFLPFAH
ncbi:Predicted nucleic acid-binding protein, contains PIN domain [Novosphingobium sp. CF614]|uniref:PIN domain-containing protein n=1 Tax=Novosphingobium sp. CF614 TaxID=1884364 RepID=UPI0008F1466D|nr:PIN domain-containing protein [Novosphingobium sp. CF614]SFG34665.1 Predicted nucleic acid-binding protein, contains PIN domain [Novosphingobium sp. CF614]